MSSNLSTIDGLESWARAHWMIAVVCAVLALLTILRFVVIPCGRYLAWRLSGADATFRELLSQRKSAEVRLGKITEQLAPLLESFPVEVGKPGTSLVFIGQPVDYVYFDPENGITFIEIKSGEARLSTSQRQLKGLVESGKVTWSSLRIR